METEEATNSDTWGDPHALTREELLRRAAAGGLLIGAGGFATAGRALASTGAATATPKRGGTLRHASTAWAGPLNLDVHKIFGFSNLARSKNLYDRLTQWRNGHVLELGLAEEFTAERADTWLIRVRKGVEFHNGKTLTADDVIFTIRRMIDPTLAALGRSSLASVDPNGFRKLDRYTVRMKLLRPDVTISDVMAELTSGIVPVGYDPTQPVGTGPFKLKSFEPRVQSDFVRNPNYWQTGLPYLDELIIFSIADGTARVNALLSGQVDSINIVPLAQIPAIRARSDLRVVNNPTSGQWSPFTMRVDVPPFNDNDVRQAMRLIADRPQMVRQALSGYGRSANDIFGLADPSYYAALPQHKQDLDRARFLLRRAGQEKLNVDLVTSNPAAGMVEAAQVLAEQAKAAGVTINVKVVDVPTLFGPDYLNRPFGMTYWAPKSFLVQASKDMLPTANENNTHWPDEQSGRYVTLYLQALQTVDVKKRTEIIHEMQRMEWLRGGHLVWAWANFVDAYSTKVNGIIPTRARFPSDNYSFERVWLA